MKKYIAYYRKSTESEDRQILSLEGQKEIVLSYAKRNGLKIVKEYKESFSAKKPGRPFFTQMTKELEKDEADGVIAYKLDRLTRNFADLGTLAQLIEQGKEIHDSSYGLYKNDANSFIMLGMNTAVASAKIKGLSEDTRRGQKQRMESGWASGWAPTGYLNNKINKTIDLDPNRAYFIKRAFELYDSGGYSLKELADKLHKEGFRTRTNGSYADKTTIQSILRNPFHYGWFRTKYGLKKGNHTPLVSKELWDGVQDRLSGRAQRTNKSKKHVFKYRGLLSCSECGCSITAETQKGHVYYRCTKSKTPCSQPYVREEGKEGLEVQLANIFDPIKIDKEIADSISKKLSELYEDDKKQQSQLERNLSIKLSRLNEEKKNLYKKMVNNQIDDQKMFNVLKEEIENQIMEIEGEMTKLKQYTYNWLTESSNLLKLCGEAKKLFLEGTREQKLKLLDFVSSNRSLEAKKVHYIYKKPFDVLVETAKSGDWLRGLDSNQD